MYMRPHFLRISCCMPAISWTSTRPYASEHLNPGVAGIAQLSGAKRVTANTSKPGTTGVGTSSATGEFGGGSGACEEADDERGWMSGPPQVAVMRVSTEKAVRAVLISVASRAKCSIAEMMLSKIGWFALEIVSDSIA